MPAPPAAAPSPPAASSNVASLPAPIPQPTSSTCGRGSLLFSDNFREQTDNWTRLGETRIGSNAYYDNGEMVLIAAEQNTKWIVTPDLTFDNVTICADLKSPVAASDLGRTAGGIIFWSRPGNMDDVYSVSIYPDGSYAILRKSDGTWSTITAKRTADSIRKGLGATNQLKLTLKENLATLSINGVTVEDFKGEPPDDGGVIGLFSRSEPGRKNEWRFQKIVVSE